MVSNRHDLHSFVRSVAFILFIYLFIYLNLLRPLESCNGYYLNDLIIASSLMASHSSDIFSKCLFIKVIQITCVYWENFSVKRDFVFPFLNFCVIYFHFHEKFLSAAVFNIILPHDLRKNIYLLPDEISIKSLMMEVPIIEKPDHWFAEQINVLVSIW